MSDAWDLDFGETEPQPAAGQNGKVTLRTGVTLYPGHQEAFNFLLSELMERCPAAFVLLADSSGQLICKLGERDGLNLVGLASLVAGDLAASQEIARMTGDFNACQMVLREGQKYNTFIADAGEKLVLFVQVSREVPLGWARMLIQFTARQAANIIAAAPEQALSLNLEMSEENLSDMVGDALDNLWMG